MSGYDPIKHALDLLSLENLDNTDPQKLGGLMVELRRRADYVEARTYLVRIDAVRRRQTLDMDTAWPDAVERGVPPMEMSA